MVSLEWIGFADGLIGDALVHHSFGLTRSFFACLSLRIESVADRWSLRKGCCCIRHRLRAFLFACVPDLLLLGIACAHYNGIPSFQCWLQALKISCCRTGFWSGICAQRDGPSLSLFSVSSLLLIISSLRCSGILEPCESYLLSVEP